MSQTCTNLKRLAKNSVRRTVQNKMGMVPSIPVQLGAALQFSNSTPTDQTLNDELKALMDGATDAPKELSENLGARNKAIVTACGFTADNPPLMFLCLIGDHMEICYGFADSLGNIQAQTFLDDKLVLFHGELPHNATPTNFGAITAKRLLFPVFGSVGDFEAYVAEEPATVPKGLLPMPVDPQSEVHRFIPLIGSAECQQMYKGIYEDRWSYHQCFQALAPYLHRITDVVLKKKLQSHFPRSATKELKHTSNLGKGPP